MALDNIGNEPRREIIEQVAGLAVVVGFLFLDYAIVAWSTPRNLADWVIGMLLVGVALFVVPCILVFLAFVMHEIGESVCALLARVGADPRPKQRYRR